MTKRVRKIKLFSEFFEKDFSCVVAVSGTAKLIKIVGCDDYKFLTSNLATGRRSLFYFSGIGSKGTDLGYLRRE